MSSSPLKHLDQAGTSAEWGTPPISFGAPPDGRMSIAALEGELSLSGDDDYAFPGRQECVESSTASRFFEARRVVSQWRFSAPPPVPFFQEVHEELTRPWKAPFTARNKSWSSTPLTTLDGGDGLGNTGIPSVLQTDSLPTLTRAPALSYSEVTVATRSGPYPAQMITAVTVSRSDDGSAPRHDLYSPERQRCPGHVDEPQRQIPSEDPSPRQPSGKDPWNQWSSYNLTLLQLEQTTGSSGQRGTAPPTEPGFSQGFFSVLSPMEFLFLAVVASGLLSWGHFISSNIIDLNCTDII